MTITVQELGYLESDYLDGPYLNPTAVGSMGMQVELVIESSTSYGLQTSFNIADVLKTLGFQAEFFVKDFETANGFQSVLVVTDDDSIGQQSLNTVKDFLNSAGMQANLNIVEIPGPSGFQATLTFFVDKPIGSQALFNVIDSIQAIGQQADFVILEASEIGHEVRLDKYPHLICGPGYLEELYSVDPYLASRLCLTMGQQAEFTIEGPIAYPFQVEFNIADRLKVLGMQTQFEILDQLATGMQVDSVNLGGIAQQFLSTLYNTTNLRILCEFPSRGINETNWTASSTAIGDFSVQNLDTDIVEEVWRSGSGQITGVRIQSDTGVPQGVFLDTLAILNHNITRSGTVTLLLSNDPTFAVIGESIPLQVTQDPNLYFISPTLPTTGYRYVRIDIDDATNTDGFIEIGTVLFGAAQIFQGECFVDEVEFELVDFTSKIDTEGFTNASNSRALKRRVSLEFRSLDFGGPNFELMRNLFETYRTTHKCLWIPTPNPNDPRATGRFATFAKLTVIPKERHKYIADDRDYVSFTLETDESL